MNTSESFKVMSSNLRGAPGDEDGVNRWDNRKKLVVGIFETYEPDIIGTQETTFGNLATYFEYLREGKGAKYYGEILGFDMNFGNFNPIFWRTDHFRLDTAGGFCLHPNKTPNKLAVEWGAAEIRSANWAIFTDIKSGDKICVVNAHFDHISEKARRNSAALIVNQLEPLKDLPTIIIGDLNSGKYTPPGSEGTPYRSGALEVFASADFVDSYSQFHEDGPESNTFHGFKGREYDPSKDYGLWRCDYILTRGLELLASEIIHDAEPPIYPSDHYPVMATIKKPSSHSSTGSDHLSSSL